MVGGRFNRKFNIIRDEWWVVDLEENIILYGWTVSDLKESCIY